MIHIEALTGSGGDSRLVRVIEADSYEAMVADWEVPEGTPAEMFCEFIADGNIDDDARFARMFVDGVQVFECGEVQ